MTQKELDAIVNENSIDTSYLWEKSHIPINIDESQNQSSSDSKNEQHDHDEYMAHLWPMPAIHENKMVYQLDEVTKESEEKASEIFDIVEEVSNELMNSEESIGGFIDVLNGNVELFKALSEKFPDVIAFKVKLEQNDSALKAADRILFAVQNAGLEMMSVMDIMQYQDIHRQKIERVINVMRSLSGYMSNLLESRVDDSKRASCAQHIEGDMHNELISNKDIESLLSQFTK